VVSDRWVGTSGGTGSLADMPCASVGLTHRLVHRELDDYYHEVVGEETAREQAKTVEERTQEAGTEGGTALLYAGVDSKSSQTFARPEAYAGFRLCDPREKRIGMVEKLFVNWSGEPEHIRVRMGFFGFMSILLPVQDVAVDKQRRILVLR
jgi:hypothetical protein